MEMGYLYSTLQLKVPATALRMQHLLFCMCRGLQVIPLALLILAKMFNLAHILDGPQRMSLVQSEHNQLQHRFAIDKCSNAKDITPLQKLLLNSAQPHVYSTSVRA